MLEITGLSVSLGGTNIITDIGFALEERQWLMVVGPNGAGKSTLISAISQGVEYKGSVVFEGEDLKKVRPDSLARRVGVLMQSHSVGYSFTVEEIVRLGRYPYKQGLFGGLSDMDEEMIELALRDTGLLPMRSQSVLTLSGGELQRTFLAQILAQNPQLLILDEPSNHLDLVYQKQVFELIRSWLAAEPGRAVLSVVHDLGLARAYGTHVMLMRGGKMIAQGEVVSALCNENLTLAYDMDVYSWMKSLLSQWE